MKLKVLRLVAAITVLNIPIYSNFADAVPKKPNIIVIMADDLGYADLGCQVSVDVQTPNIDSLAINGIRCTSGYSSCPVSSPARAGFLTGKYQQRFGHEFDPGSVTATPEVFGLSLKEKTIADYLKAAGYKTGIVGKWHEGYGPEYNPTRRGFDEFFGFPAGSHSYLTTHDSKNAILRGLEPVDEKEYLTEAFTREAVAFIERYKKETFFLYLPYNAVHMPMEVLDKYKDRFPKVTDAQRKTYLAMLAALDDGVGQVLQKLRAEKLEQNTLIFFLSGNGGPTSQTTSRNDPFRGSKGEVLEGGIRVPFIVQWKGHLPGPKIDARPMSALDILPTALAAAGFPVGTDAPFDGVNLLPFLSGENSGSPHDYLFWRYGEQSAVRSGQWKLVQIGDGAPQLYNLNQDIAEENSVASQNPAELKRLQAAYANWNSQLMPPTWDDGHQHKKEPVVAKVEEPTLTKAKLTSHKKPGGETLNKNKSAAGANNPKKGPKKKKKK